MSILSGAANIADSLKDKALNFDPTPGFNITRNAGGGIPFVSKGNGSTGVAAPSTVKAGTTTPTTTTPTDTPPDLGTGGSSGAQNGYSASDLAYLDAQEGILKTLLLRSGITLKQGLENLGDSYNKEVSGANTDRTRALEDYQMADETSTRGKDAALGNVDTNARTLNNSLRRILGLASGSDSSAYQLTAPGAVARDASGKRNNVLEDYAANALDVSTKRDRATEDFDKLLENLAAQRKSKEGDLRTGVVQNEQDVTKQIADIEAQRASGEGLSREEAAARLAPLGAAVSDKQSQLDKIFEQYRTPTYNVAAVNPQAATLRDYLVKSTGLGVDTSAAAQDPTQTNAYYLKKLQEQNQA